MRSLWNSSTGMFFPTFFFLIFSASQVISLLKQEKNVKIDAIEMTMSNSDRVIISSSEWITFKTETFGLFA